MIEIILTALACAAGIIGAIYGIIYAIMYRDDIAFWIGKKLLHSKRTTLNCLLIIIFHKQVQGYAEGWTKDTLSQYDPDWGMKYVKEEIEFEQKMDKLYKNIKQNPRRISNIPLIARMYPSDGLEDDVRNLERTYELEEKISKPSHLADSSLGGKPKCYHRYLEEVQFLGHHEPIYICHDCGDTVKPQPNYRFNPRFNRFELEADAFKLVNNEYPQPKVMGVFATGHEATEAALNLGLRRYSIHPMNSGRKLRLHSTLSEHV